MSEEQAIHAVVHLYVEGMTFAHEGALRKAFHPKASIIGNYQGAVEWLSLDEFIAAVAAEGPAPAGTQPEMQMDVLNMTGRRGHSKSARYVRRNALHRLSLASQGGGPLAHRQQASCTISTPDNS